MNYKPANKIIQIFNQALYELGEAAIAENGCFHKSDVSHDDYVDGKFFSGNSIVLKITIYGDGIQITPDRMEEAYFHWTAKEIESNF